MLLHCLFISSSGQASARLGSRKQAIITSMKAERAKISIRFEGSLADKFAYLSHYFLAASFGRLNEASACSAATRPPASSLAR